MTSCNNKASESNVETENDSISIVYYTKDISPEGVAKVFAKIQDKVSGKVGVKVHFGEEGNTYFIKPNMMKPIIDAVDGTFVETNVLYVSKRRYTDSHIKLAIEHGFTYAPIDILDAEGEMAFIANDLNHYKKVWVGSHQKDYDSYVIFSHFKGHGFGFGGAVKNVGMGLASIKGKMQLHASTIPVYNSQSCIGCGSCLAQCPADAIQLNPLRIDSSKCIGCGKCIGVCATKAFNVPWGSTDQSVFMERLAEYSKVMQDQTPMVFVNVLADMSTSCDCSAHPGEPFCGDLCIMASSDMLAIDAASHHMTMENHHCQDSTFLANFKAGAQQFDYAQKIGLGNKNYKLVEVK